MTIEISHGLYTALVFLCGLVAGISLTFFMLFYLFQRMNNGNKLKSRE